MILEWLRGDGWMVLAPIPFAEGEVPAGFVCDGISTPAFTRSFIDRQGRALRAAVIHDYLYRSELVSREEADKIFKRELRADGVGVIKSSLMYRAVRAFGWTRK